MRGSPARLPDTSRSAPSAVGASATRRTIGSVLLARTSSQLPLPSGLPQSSRRPSRRSARAAGHSASRASRAAAIFSRGTIDFRFADRVAGQFGGKLTDRRRRARPSRRAPAPCRRSCRAPGRRADRSRRRCLRRRRPHRSRASRRRRSPRRRPSGGTARRTCGRRLRSSGWSSNW